MRENIYVQLPEIGEVPKASRTIGASGLTDGTSKTSIGKSAEKRTRWSVKRAHKSERRKREDLRPRKSACRERRTETGRGLHAASERTEQAKQCELNRRTS